MEKFFLVFAVIVVVEAFVEYASTIVDLFTEHAYKKAAKQLGAIAVAVFLCFQCNADIFALCGLHFALPWLGTALTGIFGSRGSNYLSDLIKRLPGADNSAHALDDISLFSDDLLDTPTGPVDDDGTADDYAGNGAQPADDETPEG